MMLQPTREQVELRNKLLSSTNEKEKETIRERLKEIAIQRDEALKDCPFAH
ncbi:MAG: hypothetical protein ACLS4X_01370 [Ruminococcus callidus]|jgi:hypothetical protein|uniref:hypothetical protein n=1 Tax=Ruminococcus callidus TaxID=40519 RepID=UPI00207000F3|nr:MAG TPA: hypothetical protein [Caudoviricetes sp.]